MSSEAPAVRAIRLVGKWTRAAQGHVGLSGLPCSCGAGFVAVGVADFEQHLLDYLYDRHRADGDVAALFGAAGYREGASGSLTQLLRALAGGTLAPQKAEVLLADVERSVDSFETVHGKER